MSEQASASKNVPAVRAWLLVVAAMIFLTLVVGGATRLTESGLSITEWKPVSGVLPPMSDAAWQTEFKAYQAIPQYQERNRGMGLEAFKVIYWWEWTHRLLARSTGAVFLAPVPFFPLARRGAAALARAAVGDFRRRRFSWARRLVDGVVWPCRLRVASACRSTGSPFIWRSRLRSMPPCCGRRSRSRRSG